MATKKALSWAAAIALSALTAQTATADPNIFIAVRVAKPDYRFDVARIDAESAASYPAMVRSSSNHDSPNSVISVEAGYRLSRHFSVAVGYVDFREASYNSYYLFPPPAINVRPLYAGDGWSSEGFTVAAIGTIPMQSRFNIHGRLGAYFAETEFFSVRGNRGFRASEHSQEILVGAGTGFSFSDNVELSADVEHYSDIGKGAVSPIDVNLIVASLIVRF